jgi:lipopolysaccharide/colanic/teichoic acid biosynthesis glycosyltransferase
MRVENEANIPGGPRDEAVGWDPEERVDDGYLACKRVADAAAALVLLVLAAPVILLVMALVKLTSRGPALYSQVRVGLRGRPFTIYKIRTMAHECERGTGPVWSVGRDARVTALGRFLRRSHLDELPQLWNIVRGEMSLVGPRPERPEFVARLDRTIPHYRDRLLVPPGLTGLAQVTLPPDADLSCVRRKLAFDLYYVRRMGARLDMQLMCCTGLLLVGIPFSVSRRLLQVPGAAAVAEVVEDAYPRLVAEAEVKVDAPVQVQPA